jgi:LmbE family N-acetylglucosaminyl deacetylase
VARVEHLGYADSGMGPQTWPDPPGQTRFIRADVEEAAGRLADILMEESVDVLLTYDANGGYGHRDHVKVHRVGARAAELAQTPRVLHATVPSDTIRRALAVVGKVYRFPADFDPTTFERAFSPRAEITHRINVSRYASAKRASMRAHASQASADNGADRTLAAFLRIPRPLYDLVFAHEWFVDPAHPTGAPVARDVFAGLA